MELVCTRETVIKVDSFNLEEFIAFSYGLDTFEILESPNDTTHRYNLLSERHNDPESILYEYDRKDVAKMLEDGHAEYWRLHTLLDDMAQKGFIERGIYLMGVSW